MRPLVKVLADALISAGAIPPGEDQEIIARSSATALVDCIRGARFGILPPPDACHETPATVYEDIQYERIQQDQQWGGPAHDDEQDLEHWLFQIDDQIQACNGVGGPEYRERMVKVAALAVAGIESWDRVYGKAPGVSTQVAANG